ncbi:MAG: excalibur calcium-binding domain-containing protein [Desmonostoc vinosum HA7617-LM4]|nr:excalibur calcium-binding domain-containing protein [Desmonostoc vinosum HA7617-LM4]
MPPDPHVFDRDGDGIGCELSELDIGTPSS